MSDQYLKSTDWKQALRRWAVYNFRVLTFIWREFRLSLTFTTVALATASVILHEWYPISPGEEPIDWSRAAYFSLIMLTFEPALEFHSHAPWFVKALFFGFPVLGLVVILDYLSRFTKIVLQRQNNKREWFEALAKGYSGHHVVCGLGRVGFPLIRDQFKNEVPCMAVEKEENEYVFQAFKMKVPVIMGDALHRDVLDKARVQYARSLSAVTENDLVNIEIALAAYELNDQLEITVRLDNAQLLSLFRQRFQERYGTAHGETFKFTNPAVTSARVYAEEARVRNDGARLNLAGDAYMMVELKILKHSRFNDMSLKAIQDDYGIKVALTSHNGVTTWRPHPEQRLKRGDTIVVFGTSERLGALAIVQRPVVLCGLGSIGGAIIDEFKRQGTPFVLIEQDEHNPALSTLELPATSRKVIGDARDIEVLRRAGLDDADSVVAVTPDSLVNLEISLVAQRFKPEIEVVLRIDDEDMARRFQSFFEVEAISSLAIAGAYAADPSHRGADSETFYVGNKVVACMDLTIAPRSPLAGSPLMQIGQKHAELCFVAWHRGERCELLTADSTRSLSAGDSIVAIGTAAGLARLQQENRPRGQTGPLPPQETQLVVPQAAPSGDTHS